MTNSTLPKDWSSIRVDALLRDRWLLDHMDGNHGGDYPRADEFVESGIPYIAANALEAGRVDFSDARFLSPSRAAKLRKGFAQSGDVLFAHNATVGPVALLETDFETVILGTSLTYFRCNPEFLDSTYLKSFLESPTFVSQYRRLMGQSTRNQVPITAQRKFFCVIPPLAEQREIAAILSTWDRAIELTEKLLATKQKRKHALMQQLLNGKVRLPGFAKPWEQFKLSDVAENSSERAGENGRREAVFSVTNSVGMIPMEDRIIGDVARYKVVERKEFAYNPMRINVGSIAMWDGENTVSVSPDYVVFRCGKKLDPDFLNHFRHSHYWDHFVNRAGGGSVRVRIYFKDLARMSIRLPAIKEQQAISDVLTCQAHEIELLESKVELLQKQKKGLMQQLLTGKTRVNVAKAVA